MPKRAARRSVRGPMTQVNRTNEPMTVCRSSAGGPAVGAARPDGRRDAATAVGHASFIGSMHRWFPLWFPSIRLVFQKLRPSCENFGGRRWVRTTGFSLVSKVRSVPGGCWKCPDVPSSCGDRGWEWPGVSWSLWWLAFGLALGIPAPESALLDPQPPQRSGRDAARVVLLMFEAELPHALVVTLGKHGAPGLAHARDHGDSRPGKPAPGQFVAGAVLEQAKTTGAVRVGARSGGFRTSRPSCRAWPPICPRRKTVEEVPRRLRLAPP